MSQKDSSGSSGNCSSTDEDEVEEGEIALVPKNKRKKAPKKKTKKPSLPAFSKTWRPLENTTEINGVTLFQCQWTGALVKERVGLVDHRGRLHGTFADLACAVAWLRETQPPAVALAWEEAQIELLSLKAAKLMAAPHYKRIAHFGGPLTLDRYFASYREETLSAEDMYVTPEAFQQSVKDWQAEKQKKKKELEEKRSAKRQKQDDGPKVTTPAKVSFMKAPGAEHPAASGMAAVMIPYPQEMALQGLSEPLKKDEKVVEAVKACMTADQIKDSKMNNGVWVVEWKNIKQ